MKKILLIVSIVCLMALELCGCAGITPRGPTVSPQLTPATAPSATVRQSLNTPASTPAPAPADPVVQDTKEKAMMRDIQWLVSRSDEQKGQEQNYKNQNKNNLITVESITAMELKFAGETQVFKGDYTGQFTKGQKYPYFQDASAGGKRYYNVKDNFGVWVIFQYQVVFKK